MSQGKERRQPCRRPMSVQTSVADPRILAHRSDELVATNLPPWFRGMSIPLQPVTKRSSRQPSRRKLRMRFEDLQENFGWSATTTGSACDGTYATPRAVVTQPRSRPGSTTKRSQVVSPPRETTCGPLRPVTGPLNWSPKRPLPVDGALSRASHSSQGVETGSPSPEHPRYPIVHSSCKRRAKPRTPFPPVFSLVRPECYQNQ